MRRDTGAAGAGTAEDADAGKGRGGSQGKQFSTGHYFSVTPAKQFQVNCIRFFGLQRRKCVLRKTNKESRAMRRNGRGQTSGPSSANNPEPAPVADLNEQASLNPVASRQLLTVLNAFGDGDFSACMEAGLPGIAGEIAATLNAVIARHRSLALELQRLTRSIGGEGNLGGRASPGASSGSWTVCIDSINSVVADLARPHEEIARVIEAVAQGDLSQTIAEDVEGRPLPGDVLRTARLVNGTVERLRGFAWEANRLLDGLGAEAGGAGKSP